MPRRILIIFGTVLIFLTACTSIPSGLSPVTGFEADKYMGKWYEIARLDHPFERNLNDVTAIYTLGENGTDFLCPIDAVKNQNTITDREFDECVEEDVVRRYSGNIKVETA